MSNELIAAVILIAKNDEQFKIMPLKTNKDIAQSKSAQHHLHLIEVLVDSTL